MKAVVDPDSYLMEEETTLPLNVRSGEFHAAEFAVGNGFIDARSLARKYASLICDGVDGVWLFNDETDVRAPAEQVFDRDQVVGIPTQLFRTQCRCRNCMTEANDGV